MNNITEADVRAFVENCALIIKSELNVRSVWLSCSAYPDVLASAQWCGSCDSEPQTTAPTLAELTDKLREIGSAESKRAQVAEMRRKADELEASIAAEVVA